MKPVTYGQLVTHILRPDRKNISDVGVALIKAAAQPKKLS